MQHAGRIELQRAAHLRHVRCIDAVRNLPCDIGRAVVAAADVDGAAVARSAGALRKEIDLFDPIAAGGDCLGIRVVAPIIGARCRQSVPGGLIEGERQNTEIGAVLGHLEPGERGDECRRGLRVH